MKISVSKEKCGAREVVDYADTRFSNFVIEYLRENEKFHETILPVHKAPRSNFLSQIKWSKILWRCLFKEPMMSFILHL